MNKFVRRSIITLLLVLGVVALYGNDAYKPDNGELALAGVMWQRGEVSYDEETLTLSAGGNDSTKVFTGAKNMVLVILPGDTTADPDSFYATAGDSTQCAVTLRVWSDKNRTVCLNSRTLFSSFEMQVAATASNVDSATVLLVTADSTLVPYYDIKLTDSETTGNGVKYLLRVFKDD